MDLWKTILVAEWSRIQLLLLNDSFEFDIAYEAIERDILPRLKTRASHPVLAGQVNPDSWESKVCWTVSQRLCHEAVTRTP